MNVFESILHISNYQFQPWPTNSSRPQSANRKTESINNLSKLTIDTQKSSSRPGSSSKLIREYHVHIPTGSRISSPPLQPNPSPDLIHSSIEHTTSRKVFSARRYRSLPFCIKSASFSIPNSKHSDEQLPRNFPRQIHEQRKVTNERKRRKQQAQILADKYAESDSWFQLKRTLTELKRLATTQDTSIIDDEPKGKFFQSESSTSAFSNYDIHQNSFSRMSKTSSRVVYQPTFATAKPVYPYSSPHPSRPTSKPKSRTNSHRFYPPTPLTAERRSHLLVSDLSNDDNPPNTTASPSPPMIRIEHENLSRRRLTPSPTRLRPPSIVKLTSSTPPPRCHSATDLKSSSVINKSTLKFICICDQEHRIECWYHQYPFIHSDDFIHSFQSKSKTTISAFFIDDFHSSNSNLRTKIFLQGKPFHITNDWKKYDLIFISNNIYQQIIPHLQIILKSSGKLIRIYQINHDEDLKKQVKNLCKQNL